MCVTMLPTAKKEKEKGDTDSSGWKGGWVGVWKGTNLSGLRHLCFLIEFRTAAAAEGGAPFHLHLHALVAAERER